jgi:DNA repair protein RecO (recombination protein O)
MESVELTGVVLLAQPIGEYDKRLVILTRERGKITAFAHGARRPGSAVMAASNPFVFGTFSLIPGRNAYTLRSAKVANYFTELAASQPGVYYGFYFLELASFFSAEEMDAHEMVNLIYVSLKAILKGNLPLEFLRKVYECRIMAENGVFSTPDQPGSMEQSAWYALQYTAACKVTELYSFRLSERAEVDYSAYIKKMLKRTVDRPMKSLALLEVMTE